VSEYLRRELVAKLPELAGRVEVIDCGVDLRRFRGRDGREARRLLGWDGEGPFYLFVGSLDARKNPVRLVSAFRRLERGQLALIGDGPLRNELVGSSRLRLVGRVPHFRVADWLAACDVLAQPSTIEPFGQALLEAMASERSVVATRIGGPPEFVAPGAGVLVDPLSIDSIEAGLREAAQLPSPNPAARLAAAEHDVRDQAGKIAALLAAAARRRR
jgi:glycosyltransferase involved in cell wall biosynthesis